MSNPFFILDGPLPPGQDFTFLKDEGMSRVQLYSGAQWTNLNPSDPGITMLDQLCYALTELGYCTGFSMADMLTTALGQIQYKDQFYLPGEILTTAPVTVDDYRQYLVDGVSGVSNAIIVPSAGPLGTRVYRVFLQLAPGITSAEAQQDVCTQAFYYLGRSRNLAEFFEMPQVLSSVPLLLSGRIDLEKESDFNTVMALIKQAVADHVLPQHIGGNVRLPGPGDNGHFNGPLLSGAQAIDTGSKKNHLTGVEIGRVVASVKGVVSAGDLSFRKNDMPLSEVSCDPSELFTIDVRESVRQGTLRVYSMGRNTGSTTAFYSMDQSGTPYTMDDGVLEIYDAPARSWLPQGKYRDINSYYSIQNTMPDIFAVGPNSIAPDASPTQVAQSRQLKGYLALFDQVLANQFSQLASLGRLMSFKNALTGTPSDEHAYYAAQDATEKAHPLYPVPYEVFSPTYFYQSLYNVPGIRYLLKNNEAFNTSLEPEDPRQQEAKSWEAYKHDPYNSYIHGLMQLMEKEETGLTRRNEILNHLLARHGESPAVIDAVIDGSQYTGDPLKDQVIFKSLYLQNLGLLSYNRNKAYHFKGAKKIDLFPGPVPDDYLLQSFNGVMNDFIFESERTDAEEKLSAADFINFSGIELRIGLLLGLKPMYRQYISACADQPDMEREMRMAYWLITQRRGFIFFETGLLLNASGQDAVNTGSAAPVMADLEFIFPDFIVPANDVHFRQRLTAFLDDYLPVQCSYRCSFVNIGLLDLLAPAFALWHNSLIYSDTGSPAATTGTDDPSVALKQWMSQIPPQA